MLAVFSMSPDLGHLLLILLAAAVFVGARVTKDKHPGFSAALGAVGEVLGVHPNGPAILEDVRQLLEDRGAHPKHVEPLLDAFEQATLSREQAALSREMQAKPDDSQKGGAP